MEFESQHTLPLLGDNGVRQQKRCCRCEWRQLVIILVSTAAALFLLQSLLASREDGLYSNAARCVALLGVLVCAGLLLRQLRGDGPSEQSENAPVGILVLSPAPAVPAAVVAATEIPAVVTAAVVTPLVFSINGVEKRLSNPLPSMLLVDYLRSSGLTGAKVGCGEGGCGACSVIAVGADGVPRAINSCLRLLCSCDGLAITTVEALGSKANGFSDVQKAMADHGGTQCGFCTPGWVAAATALLAAHSTKPLSPADIEAALDGNLCRCTGYRPILAALRSFGDDIEDLGKAPCHNTTTGKPCGRACEAAHAKGESRPAAASDGCCQHKRARVVRLEAASACAAPVAIRAHAASVPRALRFVDISTDVEYTRPTSLLTLSQILSSTPRARIVLANTGMGCLPARASIRSPCLLASFPRLFLQPNFLPRRFNPRLLRTLCPDRNSQRWKVL